MSALAARAGRTTSAFGLEGLAQSLELRVVTDLVSSRLSALPLAAAFPHTTVVAVYHYL
jgi:hypothetical protein